jgi:transposase-like protein
MKKTRHSTEQIMAKLREAEVGLAKGETVGAVCRRLEITEQTHYRWRKEYGGLRIEQAKRPPNGEIASSKSGAWLTVGGVSMRHRRATNCGA